MMGRATVKSWALSSLLMMGLWACGDDEGSPDAGSSLDGGLDLDGSVTTPDASVIKLPDGAVVMSDAQVAMPPPTGMNDSDGSCAPLEQLMPVTAPAYHREGTIVYTDIPPVGGDHNPCWGKWRVYDADEPLRVERWVHNLEHGGVIVLYNCPSGCSSEVDQLARFVKGRRQALLTSYDALPTRFAVVSWGARVTSECLDIGTLERFYSEHVDQGPESISSDPPSSCL